MWRAFCYLQRYATTTLHMIAHASFVKQVQALSACGPAILSIWSLRCLQTYSASACTHAACVGSHTTPSSPQGQKALSTHAALQSTSWHTGLNIKACLFLHKRSTCDFMFCLSAWHCMLCRRRDTGRIHSIAALPPPPLPTEPEMLFANPVSLATITQQSRDSSAMPSLDFTSCCARVGRGGRLIMSRCQPFTYEPLDIQQPAEESQKMPFDLTAPYAAAAQAPQKPVSAAKQHSRGAGHSKQASPAAQASSRQQPQQQQQQPVSAGRVPASSSTQQAQQAQHAQQHQQAQPQAQPSAQGPGQNGHSPAAPAQPALQQTRQQQAQAQSQAQLIEMPIQPGASQTAPTPAKSKVCSVAHGHNNYLYACCESEELMTCCGQYTC